MSLESGINNIKEALKQIPSKPGIYRMIDEQQKVLYIGKAKNLTKRITNYTQPERLNYRIIQMVSKVRNVITTQTSTESEALLLEANLIKKHRPHYNILLKDDKSFPYILLTENHNFPRITKHRGKKKEKGKYFGPFPSASSVNTAIADLQKSFLLRPCSDSFFEKRTRPCMEYQIKRCSAPCVDKITIEEYSELVAQAKSFLKGKTREIQDLLHEKMMKASDNMEYEKAASFRNRIQALNQVQSKQNIYSQNIKDADIIGLYNESGQCCIQIFFYRNGLCFGNQAYFPVIDEYSNEDEIISAFLLQYYQTHLPPNSLIISHEISNKQILEQALTSISDHKISINHAKKGEKRELVENAIKNANNSLRQKLLQTEKQKNILKELQEIFSLPRPIKRIEVYDNSHIMGKYDTGAMIVAGPDGFIKKAYRRFNIKGDTAGTGDDYAMIEQVITRRFTRLLQDSPKYQEHIWPDLVIIDGGIGQMSSVEKALKSLSLDNKIPFICISKGPDRNAGREKFHMPGNSSFTIPYDSATIYYLQRLRDEAHNYAIGTHRKKRSKSIEKSLLDEIPGIGGKRKRDLLQHFGSAKDVISASVSDLQKVPGISKSLAQIICNFNSE